MPDETQMDDGDGDGVEDRCDCAPANASAYGDPIEVPTLRLAVGAMTWLGWDPAPYHDYYELKTMRRSTTSRS